jgi:hypothetical protein
MSLGLSIVGGIVGERSFVVSLVVPYAPLWRQSFRAIFAPGEVLGVFICNGRRAVP